MPKYGVQFQKNGHIYHEWECIANDVPHAIYLARMERKRFYNNGRRITGHGIKGLKIFIIVNPQ